MVKVENRDFKGQTHEEAVTSSRKNLLKKLANRQILEDYELYNSLALSSLLGRLQSVFEDTRKELLEELKDTDYDDIGTASLEDIFKAMKLIGISSDSLDEELREFLAFMAMRHSQSLEEINYEKLLAAFDSDYMLIEDKSIW